MKGYPHSLNLLATRSFNVIPRIFLRGWDSHPSIEMQSMYYTASSDWAVYYIIAEGYFILSFFSLVIFYLSV